jgi:hypothetical protein
MVVYAGRTFDRRPQFDPKSLDYPVRRLLNVRRLPRSYTWRCPLWLDQGQEGECVGYSFAHELAARPVMVKGISNFVAHGLYTGARRHDEWPGEDYEGSSVLGGAKYMTTPSGGDAVNISDHQSWYKSYAWGRDVLDLRDYVAWRGPAVLGIPWYEGMITPSSFSGSVYVYPRGEVVGGHAILCNGYSVSRNAFRLHNSWGRSWGDFGGAWVRADDMARLLFEDGECCMPLREPYLQAVESAVRAIARGND